MSSRLGRRCGSGRGASRFTTWAYKCAVFEVLTTLPRHWRGGAILTADDDPLWARLADHAADAHAVAQSLELVRALRQAVEEQLTPRQRDRNRVDCGPNYILAADMASRT